MGHHLDLVFIKIMLQKNLMEKLQPGTMELQKQRNAQVLSFLNCSTNLDIAVKHLMI